MTTNTTKLRTIRHHIPSDGYLLCHTRVSCQNFKPEPSKVLELTSNLHKIKRRKEHVIRIPQFKIKRRKEHIIRIPQGHNSRLWETLQKKN